MTTERKILYGVILVLILWIFFFEGCKNTPKEYNVISTTEVYRDTIVETRTYETVKDSFIYEVVEVQVPDGTLIDTMAILTDYFNKIVYNDTITDDSTYIAIIQDTISQNRIEYRDFKLSITQPTIINTTINKTVVDTCPNPKHKIYLGMRMGGNETSFTAGPSLLILPKQQTVSLGYDYDLVNKTHNIRLHKLISFKKNK